MARAPGRRHTGRMDLDAARAAGIGDAPRRAALLDYLEAQGFGLEEMVEAEAQGRLFALAGDALARSGRARHSLSSAAAQLELPVEEVAHAWAVLGLTVTDVHQPALSDADLAGLRTWADVAQALRSDVARCMAARLVAVAEPGQVLAPPDLCERLIGWRSEPLEPVTLRGFDGPLTPYALRR